jgi:hypothetical protein
MVILTCRTLHFSRVAICSSSVTWPETIWSSHRPGTEFLDAETGRPKSPLKCANARRDQNPGSGRA